MGVIETRTFKSGNSVAVRLPKALGLEAGTPVTIEENAGTLTIRALVDRDAEKRDLTALIDKIRAIWDEAGGPPPPERREPIEFPDRPGLY